MPTAPGGDACAAASTEALRFGDRLALIASVGEGIADLVLVQEEHVAAIGDHAVANQCVTDGETERAEQHDAHLVDVERVVLGQRHRVLGGLVELVELGHAAPGRRRAWPGSWR